MKTSNIILLSLMSSFSMIIIAGATELRLFGSIRSGNAYHASNVVKELDKTLEPFQILVIHESINLDIEKGDSLCFKIYRGKDDVPPVIQFHQSVDTLFIDKIAYGENGRSLHAIIQLKDTRALRVIMADHSSFTMEELDGESLSVHLKASTLNVTSKHKPLQNLSISAKDSYVFYDSEIPGQLETDLDHSEVEIRGTVSQLKASITNDSDLQLHNVGQIIFKKDSTSSIRIY